MGCPITDDGKLKEKRGTGTKASYKPWVKIREVNTRGVATSYPDWKHGRMLQLLSIYERAVYIMLRWDDRVDDIREHYPLDIKLTNAIAQDLGVRPLPGGRRMTTDMLVSLTDGTVFACSICSSREKFRSDKRGIELKMIEYRYWKSKGVPWKLIFEEDVNLVEARNIEDIVSFYNRIRLDDDFGLAKYLLAHKIVTTDLSGEVDYRKLIAELKETEIWMKYSYMLG